MTTRLLNALTPRERQVLAALIEGHTTREIAESYGIGRQTVKNYVTVIYEKLGVEGRRQLLLDAGKRAAGSEPQPGLNPPRTAAPPHCGL